MARPPLLGKGGESSFPETGRPAARPLGRGAGTHSRTAYVEHLTKRTAWILGFAAAALGMLAIEAFPQDANRGWVTAWGTSQQALAEAKISNATVRMIARVTIPGDSIRIRLDNTFGTVPVTFGSVTIAPRIQGPAVAAGLNKAVTFSEKSSVTI